MEIVKCSKGHFYDKSLGQCPVCAAEANPGMNAPFVNRGVEDFAPTEPMGGAAGFAPQPGFGAAPGFAPAPNPGFAPPPAPGFPVDDIGPTQPDSGVGFGGDVGVTQPDLSASFGGVGQNVGLTQPDPMAGFPHTAPENKPAGNLYNEVEDYDATRPVMNDAAADKNVIFDPVVGWLVCTDGPNRGRDYRLHSGINSIGRLKSNDVCIENDNTISKVKDAMVSYDAKSMSFYVAKGEGRNLVYKNGKPVLSADYLAAYDTLIVGETTLVFIPLCSENFNW